MNWQKCSVCGETWWPEQEGEQCPYCIYGNKAVVCVSTVNQLAYSIRMAKPEVMRIIGLVRPRAALRSKPRLSGGSIIVDLEFVPL